MKKVLLHICCAGCATVCIERLQQEGFNISGLFYNPNIYPGEEYKRRRDDLDIISKKYALNIIESDYDAANWLDFVKGCEKEKEGGKRCALCFEFRLKKAYEVILKEEIDFFTTTLTISPHKKSNVIHAIGRMIGQERFLCRDFKKKEGFKESIALSKGLGLHRQHYCGCIYSQGGR